MMKILSTWKGTSDYLPGYLPGLEAGIGIPFAFDFDNQLDLGLKAYNSQSTNISPDTALKKVYCYLVLLGPLK